MPTMDASGRWVSDDGRFVWDGTNWQPVSAPVTAGAGVPIDRAGDPQPAYGPAANLGSATPGTGHAAAAAWSLGLAMFSVIAWLLPIVGIPVSITGIVLGARGWRGSRPSMATWGMAISAATLLLGVINAIAGVVVRTHG